MNNWINKNVRPYFKVPGTRTEMDNYAALLVITYLATVSLTIVEAKAVAFLFGSITPGSAVAILIMNILLWTAAVCHLEWTD